MGRRGPPPKPTALKVLQGNPGKRRLNDSEPTPPPGPVSPPSWLTGKSRRAWRWIAPVLDAMGCLTTADPHALAMLCDAYGDYLDARTIIRDEGRTYESRHLQMDAAGNTFERVIIRARPEVAMMSDAWKRMRVLMQEFGMTPSSRSRIKTGAPAVEADPFDSWLDRRAK